MKTTLTAYDVVNYLNLLFADETQVLSVVSEDGESRDTTAAELLNIDFYAWKHREEEAQNFIESFATSIDLALGLVEVTDIRSIASPDIDSATITAHVTVLAQSHKMPVLEQYILHIRNNLLGNVQKVQNRYGEDVRAFINLGILFPESDIETEQLGEIEAASFNITFDYLADAFSYEDEPVWIKFGSMADFELLPYSKWTAQVTMSGATAPLMKHPTVMGVINENASVTFAATFFDFNKPLTNALNKLYAEMCAAVSWDATDDVPSYAYFPGELRINDEIKIREKYGDIIYEYPCVLTSFLKQKTNADFSVSTMTLALNGKAVIVND